MIEFTDIRIRAALPLHPYLARHPRLSLKLVADENVCGETPGVSGDLVNGTWTFNSKLFAAKDVQTQAVSVTVNVAELRARIKDRAKGYQDFDIFDSSTPLQLKLVMTCHLKLCYITSGSSQVIGNRDPTKETQPNFGSLKLRHPSRDELEFLYAQVIRIPDQDDNKARMLRNLGGEYHELYEGVQERTDLERAVSLYEQAIHFTRPFHPQLAERARAIATALEQRFKKSGDPADIERAISHCQAALKFTEDRDAHKPLLLNNLGRLLLLRFERTDDLGDMENSISCRRRSVELTADGHPEKLSLLVNLATALQLRYTRLGGLADINEAILNLQQAVDLAPDGHPDKQDWLTKLGVALQRRFECLGSLADIDNAISNHQKAVKSTPDGHPDKSSLLNNLGAALQRRFERTGSLADIDEAILNLQKAVKFTPDGHPDKLSQLNNLGAALQSRFERLGNLADIDDAILNLQKAVKFTPDGHPKKSSRLNNLGMALKSRFGRLGDLTDINDAISNQEKAVKSTPDGHPDKSIRLNNLGNSLQCRFSHLGSPADIDHSISNWKKAVELTPDDHPDKPNRLSGLGSALEDRFERLGTIEDIYAAISNHQKAVACTPDGHSSKPRLLSSLGSALQSRFERFGNLADLDHAISSKQRAVEYTEDGHPEKPNRFTSLGSIFQCRFERLGSLADLDEAISNFQKAVELTPDDHPAKSGLLNNLGLSLQRRFEHLGSLADIADAISDFREAVELMPDGHSDRPLLLSNLGVALLLRFERISGLIDLNEAVLNIQKSVKLTAHDHPERSTRLDNLGTALLRRFERLGSSADMDDAILNQQKAMELTPDGHPDKPNRLCNLGHTLQCRYEHINNLADVDTAISYFQKAVEMTADGHPGKPTQLFSLGGGLLSRFLRVRVPSDVEGALSADSAAAKSTNGPAMVRFKAARRWAKVAEQCSRSPLDAFSCAIDLVPRIAWLGLAVTDQHALLANVGGIVRDAVAAAIRYEEYETAVVWAEQGRSIVWQNLLGLRIPVDDLRRDHPQLADRLQNIARQLEGSGSRDTLGNEDQTMPVEDASRGYSKLAFEWDKLVDEIRGIPNFEGFLRPKYFSQLAPAAHEGPVVILNANNSRCDALALIPDNSAETHVSVINIPLERFSYDKSKKLFQALMDLLSSAGVRERNDRKTGRRQSEADDGAKFKRILHILWQDVVKPVIEGLALQTESKRPPRIWWCATGLLAFLPIHAAGLYESQEIGEKVSDYVVSSYTPTLTAILELSEPAVQEDFQVLMVAQASAPGAPPIPKTEDEVRIIHRLTAGVRKINLMRENATVKRVREGMMESNWIHLACHGQQNPDDPMESGFLLHDKILKLSEIVKMLLPKTDFAFLSACQTAMGDERLAEESVHLAAGMFLSGCRGVIATTWSIRDDDGPEIAEDVYSRIFKDGKPNRKEAAYALHEAVRRPRESGAPCTSWVPFIHIGR